MTDTIYSMSFTTAPLLFHKTLLVAKLYTAEQDWQLVRKNVLHDNLLQMRTVNASKRVFREISSRLKQLTPAQLKLLLDSNRPEQNYLLWLAFCKRYRFVYDFAVEVVREKFLRLDMELTHEAYDIFFNDKAEWHPEVERVAPSTRQKQRQIVFKTMREAEIITEQNQIIPARLSPRLTAVIRQDNPAHLAIYPIR
jgi:hypothetical protein